MKNVLALVGWVALSLLAGLLGSIASANDTTFYAQLSRPAWAPPSWLFAPVWTTLYLLMGVAAWLVWRRRDRDRQGASVALALFVAQLVLNALWTWIFFTWRRGGLALIEIVVLGILIVATIVAFGRVRRSAALLLLPYLAWVMFATALTAAIWRRNPTLL